MWLPAWRLRGAMGACVLTGCLSLALLVLVSGWKNADSNILSCRALPVHELTLDEAEKAGKVSGPMQAAHIATKLCV